jgi:hypothetical protein
MNWVRLQYAVIEHNAMLHDSITYYAMLCLLYCAGLFLTSVKLLQTDYALYAQSNPSVSSFCPVQTYPHNPFALLLFPFFILLLLSL